MNKEPLGLYIFRFIVGLGLFIFLLMLYWSTSLIEKDLKSLQFEISQLKNDLVDFRSDISQMQIRDSSVSSESNSHSNTADQTHRKHIDESYPNLLEEDPFYTETLPKMLGPDFKYYGVFQRSAMGKPDNLHPFSNWYTVNQWRGLCVPAVARLKFGKYETLAPSLGIKLEERRNKDTGLLEFWVHLRDKVYWQPLNSNMFTENIKLAPYFLKKHQVTAHDFKFYFDAMMNPFLQESGAVALRNYYSDIESVEVLDDLTFIVRWKNEAVTDAVGTVAYKPKYVAAQLTGGLNPLPRFVYQYFPDGKKIIEDDTATDAYRTNSVWAQNFAQHWAKNIIVGCGPWIFESMSDRQIKFRRNPSYFSPYDALAEGIEVLFKDSFDAIWQLFKANGLDYYEIRPDQLSELEVFMQSPQYAEQSRAGSAIRRLDYLGHQYGYIGWNEAKPFFKSKKVRQALTMAIDRQRIISQIMNNMGVEINGTFSFNSPAYNKSITPWPFDLTQAKKLLEEEGWYDSDGDGIIDKIIDGERVPFSFNLTYYVKGVTGKSISEYVATALKEIGINANLQGVDIADLTATFENKNFDAIMLNWALGTPPEDPRQLWYSKGSAEKGSSNAIGFANSEADAIIDALTYESDPEKRLQLYHRFGAILHDEAPYVFLFTPKISMIYREYLQNVFIPSERQDLIPGANIGEPDSSIFWLKKR